MKSKWATTLEYQTVAYNSQDDRMLAPQNHRIKQPYASGVCNSRQMPTAIKPTTIYSHDNKNNTNKDPQENKKIAVRVLTLAKSLVIAKMPVKVMK